MQQIDLTIPSGAIFSEDRAYRYVLWRVWHKNKPMLGQTGLNPSKANEDKNDPTITRSIVRACKEGFGGLVMTNLYGLVSTDPKALLNNDMAVGDLNDFYIKMMVSLTSTQLCMWGSFKPVKFRAPAVYKMLNNPCCLAINPDGEPKHSLYVSYSTKIIKYSREER
jgi:hypothetical protein